jgi:uncharacterized protein YqgV (UPF0045/DUF77 family)
MRVGSRQILFVVMEHGERDLTSILKEYSCSQRGLTNVKTKFYWEEMLEAVQVAHQVLHQNTASHFASHIASKHGVTLCVTHCVKTLRHTLWRL